jgi:amino acid transporter
LNRQEESPPPAAPVPIVGLHRVLGTFDIVLLNVAAIISFRWLAVAAQVGPSSLTLWVLGLLTFFVPSALTVLELNSRLPGEGGMYTWSKTAFGDVHAFVVGWSYWVGNLVFFPSILLFAAGVFLYSHDGWLRLADSAFYNAAFSLTVLWLAIILNVLGLERAKWLQNIGGIATWMVPPTNTISPWLFGLKVVGGCFIMIAAGLVLYARGRRAAAVKRAADRSGEVSRDG